MEKPRFYILPGWGHRITDRNYRKLISIVSKKYLFTPLALSTRNRKYSLGGPEPVSTILKKIEEQIAKPCGRDVILGFSVGALQAYLLARRLDFKHAILCSLSPVLGKDILLYRKKELSDFSLVQRREMKKMNYPPLATKKVTLLYGGKEHITVKNRAKRLSKRKGWRAIEIRNADHDLGDAYLKGIKKVLL